MFEREEIMSHSKTYKGTAWVDVKFQDDMAGREAGKVSQIRQCHT